MVRGMKPTAETGASSSRGGYNLVTSQDRGLKVRKLRGVERAQILRYIGDRSFWARQCVYSKALRMRRHVQKHFFLKEVGGVRLHCRCSYSKLHCISTPDRHKQGEEWRDNLPIFTDFAVYDSQNEVEESIRISGLPREVLRKALIPDMTIRKLKVLVYTCPRCCRRDKGR